MEIEVTHHLDSCEICPDASCDWYYEYHLFRFTEHPLTLIARSYVDSPEEAHFLNLLKGLKSKSLSPEDLELPLFQQAVQHLREAGKTSIHWLADCGYEPV